MQRGKELFLALTDRSWVQRQRSATIFDKDGETLQRTTMDVVVPCLVTLNPKKAQIAAVMPIGMLEKTSLNRLNAEFDGKTTSIATKSECQELCIQALLWGLSRIRSCISAPTRKRLHHVVPLVVSATTERDERAAFTELANCAEIEAVFLGTSRHPEVAEWVRIVLELLWKYPLLIFVPLDAAGQRRTVKLEYALVQRTDSPDTQKRVDKFISYKIPFSRFSPTASFHQRVELPEQLRVVAVGPLQGKKESGAFEQTDVLHLEKQGSIVWSVLESLTSDTGRLRGWDVKIDAVQFGLVPFAIFFSRWLWVAFGLLWLGVGLVDQDSFSQSRENIRSTIPLLLAVPALLLTWINRSKEHVLVKAVLRPYRRILWLSAGILYGLALLVALPLNFEMSLRALAALTLAAISVRVMYLGLLERPLGDNFLTT